MRTDHRNNIVRAGLLQEIPAGASQPGVLHDRNAAPAKRSRQLTRVDTAARAQGDQTEFRSHPGQMIDHLLVGLPLDKSHHDTGASPGENPAKGIDKSRRAAGIVANVKHYRRRRAVLPENLKPPRPFGVLDAVSDGSDGKR